MGCLLLGIALFLPRFALFLILLFTNWIGRAFDGWLVPVLGFFFLPYSTVWYTMVMTRWHGEWGFWQIIFMAIAVLMDFSSNGWFIGKRHQRNRDQN
jgi:hypothetical protein